MKFRTTAIAIAVAGTVAAPVAVQAGADGLYASARVGLWYNDTGGTGDLDVKSFSSRFGARGETDLGNGLTGFGRYEWDVDMGSNDSAQITTRHRYVGLKGDWGSVLIGQTYNTFYNFVVGPTDIPWWHSGYAMVDYVSRTDDAITYAGGSDSFNFGATGYFTRDTDEEALDVYEVGASYTFGNDMTLGVAMRGTNGDESKGKGTLIGAASDKSVFGAVLSGISLGDFGIGIGAQAQDDDTSVLADITYNNFYAHIETYQVDKDSNASVSGDDEDKIGGTLGYTQSLGRNTTMYYELYALDSDTNDDNDDITSVMAVLKYDII